VTVIYTRGMVKKI